jgi:hypothetical protein
MVRESCRDSTICEGLSLLCNHLATTPPSADNQVLLLIAAEAIGKNHVFVKINLLSEDIVNKWVFFHVYPVSSLSPIHSISSG